MRSTTKILALALTVTTGALWAQSSTPTPAEPIADQGSASAQPVDPASPTPPVSANPANQEDDALPQSAQTPEKPAPVEPIAEPTAQPVNEAAPEKPAEPAPQPQLQIANGSVVSTSATSLVIETANGAKLSFVIDAVTSAPEVHVQDKVSVEYVTLADGTRRASRVTVATPKTAAVAPVPRSSTPAAPKKAEPVKPAPAIEPARPTESVAVVPPASAEPATPLATADSAAGEVPATEPLASSAGASSAEETHTLGDSTQAASPLAANTVARDRSPIRMAVPIALLMGGLLFITVLGVRQARHEA